MAREITLQAWQRTWGNPAYISFKLDFNALNFAILASKYATSFFKQSFRSQGFNKTGKKWKRRKDSLPHKILLETGELMGSIKYSGLKKNFLSPEVSVQTNEKYGNRSGKKQAGYAAVHNEAWQKTGFYVNQYSTSRPVQRQFMGHNNRMYKDIARKYNRVLKAGLF